MLRAINRGYTVEFKLPRESKYSAYSVESQYKYNHLTGKYIVSMLIKKNGIDIRYSIDSAYIDTQELSGDRNTIRDNIGRVVEQMLENGCLDYYIKQYEDMIKHIRKATPKNKYAENMRK